MDKRQEMYERARNNSVGEDKKVRYVKMRHELYVARLKASFIAGAVIGILVVGGLVYGSSTAINKMQEYGIVNEELSQYSTIVNQNTHRTDDNQHYFYDTSDIASEISDIKEDDIDKAIFGVYSNIGYNDENKIEQMNNIMNSVNFSKQEEAKGFDNFNDYVVSKGFVDKDGKADYDAYTNAMAKMIVDEHNINELQSQVDQVKNR